MAAGNQSEAIVAYRGLLEFHPDHEEGLDGIGRALVLAGNYREAIEYFNRSLVIAPSAVLYNRLGVAHDLIGDGDGAQDNYKAALKLDPEAISPRNNLALSFAVSESYEDAIEQIERVAAHPQATKKHRQNMIFIYGMAGENDEALASLSENGLTRSEIARNRELFKRIRAHAKAGNRAEIPAYLRNGHELGEPTIADNAAELGDSSSDMASSSSDQAENPSFNDEAESFAMPAKEKTVRTASPSKPVRLTPKRPARAKMTRVGKAIYRVQLAAYRTSKTAVRGVKILKSLMRDGATDLKILVKATRSKNERAIDYRIRTPQMPNLEIAGKICSKFKAAGHSDCLVILHNPQVWAAVAQPNSLPVSKSSPPARSSPDTPSTSRTKVSYRVQLASYRTERGATRGHAVLKKLLVDRNENLDVLVRRTRSEDSESFDFQIRSGPIESRAEGAALCEAVKKVGHSGCLVIQHNERVWSNLAVASISETAAVQSDKESVKRGVIKQDQSKKGRMKKSPEELTMSKIRKIAPPTRLTPKNESLSKNNDQPTFRVQLASFQTE